MIPPEEIIVGKTFVTQTDKCTGNVMQVEHKDTYQYVPIRTNLQRFLQQPGVLQVIMEEGKSNNEKFLESYRDGLLYKKQNTERQHSYTLPIVLYNDAFETANPLGSR